MRVRERERELERVLGLGRGLGREKQHCTSVRNSMKPVEKMWLSITLALTPPLSILALALALVPSL